MSTETESILNATIHQLAEREVELQAEIERVQGEAKAELRDVRKALTALQKQIGKPSANGAGAEPEEPTNEVKEAVMRELQARRENGPGGARPAAIGAALALDPGLVRRALEELAGSGDVESYGKGLWRLLGS